MSHFAKVKDGIVQTIIVADQGYVDKLSVEEGVAWIQTSYNTRGGVHYAPHSNTPDGGVALRKNFAGLGYTYDSGRDAFYEPQPYPSWTLDNNCLWQPPTPYPDHDKRFVWNEDTTSWDVPPSPYPSWILNEGNQMWEPPTEYPTDGNIYEWDEDSLSWVVPE